MTFMGHRYDIVSCFADSGLYLHPSHREDLPLAIMESMEFGLPTVAWDIPACDELVTDGENGTLVKFGDADSAANEVETFLNDLQIYQRASTAATRRFREKHDISDYAPRRMNIYQQAMADMADG